MMKKMKKFFPTLKILKMIQKLKLRITSRKKSVTFKKSPTPDDSEEEDEEEKWKEPEKSWQMKGEVRADQRGFNTLLEEDLEITSTARPAPEYTDEMTKNLEDIFKKIILESAFDNVVRK